jgi:hypothetical protein
MLLIALTVWLLIAALGWAVCAAAGRADRDRQRVASERERGVTAPGALRRRA